MAEGSCGTYEHEWNAREGGLPRAQRDGLDLAGLRRSIDMGDECR